MNASRRFLFAIFVILLLMVSPIVSLATSTLLISHVSHEPAVYDPDAGGEVQIFYRLSKKAETVVKIFDARDQLIRSLSSNHLESADNHQLVWDGKDETGQLVPPNYYNFVVEALGQNGEKIVHDLTDLTGGQVLTVSSTTYDPGTGVVDYVLPANALVNIRVGLSNGGPLLSTIVDWVSRPAGRNVEFWNGWDNKEVLNVSQLKQLQIGVSAYSLPHNSIIVMTKDRISRPVFINTTENSTSIRETNRHHRKQMYNHWQHPRDKCYDPAIRLSLPHQVERRADGLPEIEKSVTISMNVAEQDQLFIYDQRFEVVFYVDFIFVYEEELGYTPFNWQWDIQGVNEGIHYITAMLRGYEGHFGTTTLKVFVKNPSPRKSLTEK